MIKISVIIPVFNTQNELPQCLESVFSQTLKDIEVLIVDDGSDEKPSVKDIIKKNFKKEKRLRIIRHTINEGLVEARRSGVSEASGTYVFFLDSDDCLTQPDALEILYKTAEQENADIVQCCVKIESQQKEINIPSHYKIAATPQQGLIEGQEIFKSCFFHGEHTWYLWGKLFRHSLCLKSYEWIPETYCVMSEDLLQYFFISRMALRYIGISEELYCYRVGNGISTTKKITSLESWKSYCSAASVFTILLMYQKEHPLEEETQKKLAGYLQQTVLRSITRLEKMVLPELKQAAREMLCNAWGNMIVEKMEAVWKQDETKWTL